jgi:hypothetical protein
MRAQLTALTRYFTAFAALFLLISFSPLIAAKSNLKITTFDTPYSTVMTRIIREAYKLIGREIDVAMLPGSRAIKLSGLGAVDGELYRIGEISNTYPDLVRVNVVIANLEVRAFSHTLDFIINGWSSLKPYRLAVMQGVKVTDMHTQNMQRVMVNNFHQLFNLLSNERVDLVITTNIAGRIAIKEMHLKNIKMLSPAIHNFKVYHFVHKKNRELVPLLTAALTKMKKQGRIDQIFNEEMEHVLTKYKLAVLKGFENNQVSKTLQPN